MRKQGMYGKHHSDVAKDKMRQAKLGGNLSEQHRKNIGVGLMGRSVSGETRRKIAATKIGKPRSVETRKKLSDASRGKPRPYQRGEKSRFWRGGIADVNNKIRQSLEYKLWREAVFQRDNYACIWGGKTHGNKLNADHIKPFALYPELRFAIDNGRTLCEDCHKKTDTYGLKALKN